MKDLASANLDKMTPAEFEEYLPELFESGGGSISKDPRFANFFKSHPDCAALVSDLEIIAEQAKSLFEPSAGAEPSDTVWSNIASKLKEETPANKEKKKTSSKLEEETPINKKN